MASKLFDYDNPFFMFMSRIWDLMILNFLAVLLCLPVITAGASVTALYYITLKMAEDRESHIYRSFLKSFRDNLVQSTAIHLIVTAAGAVLLLDFWYFVLGGRAPGASASDIFSAGIFSSGSPARFAAAALLLALMLLYLFITVYVYAIQARFVNTVFKTIINAFMMAVRHLPSTVLMIILNSVFFYTMFHYASWLGFWVLSGPVYLNSLLLCRIFKRYMQTDAKEITETDKNTAE